MACRRRLSGKGNDKPLEAAVQLQEEATEQGRQSCAGTDDVGCNMVVAGGAESKTTINVDTKCTPTSLNPDEQLSSDMGDFVQTTVTQAYPFGHLQLGLLSEPTSLASTNLHSHVSQDPGLFSRKPPQEELLPRVMGGVETISEMDITVGAADKKMEAAATRYSMRPAEDVLIPEPIAEKPAIKLTAGRQRARWLCMHMIEHPRSKRAPRRPSAALVHPVLHHHACYNASLHPLSCTRLCSATSHCTL